MYNRWDYRRTAETVDKPEAMSSLDSGFLSGQQSIQFEGQCQCYGGGEVRKCIGGTRRGFPVNIVCVCWAIKWRTKEI